MIESRFRDKVVLVTGAAGGIGAAVAMRFAQEGARVVIADLNGDAASAAAARIASDCGVETLGLACDVGDDAEPVGPFRCGGQQRRSLRIHRP